MNILNKNDIVYINGVRFRVKYDFGEADKNLLLKREESPQTYIAYSSLGADGCKTVEQVKGDYHE